MKRHRALLFFLTTIFALVFSCYGAGGSKNKGFYVVGDESNDINNIAKYWINGATTALPDGSNTSSVCAIVVN